MTIKLVMFDLDGVLVDACEWHRVALNQALKEVCDYEISLEDHYNDFNGIPTKVKLNKLLAKGVVKPEQMALIEDIKQVKTIEIIQQQAYVRNEKVALLKALKDNEIKVACYTNSIKKTANLMLSVTGILDLFDMVITNQDVNLPKPNPEGYEYCIRSFGCTPDECLIVEDSPKGIEAAQKSKAHVLIVQSPDDVTKENVFNKIGEL